MFGLDAVCCPVVCCEFRMYDLCIPCCFCCARIEEHDKSREWLESCNFTGLVGAQPFLRSWLALPSEFAHRRWICPKSKRSQAHIHSLFFFFFSLLVGASFQQTLLGSPRVFGTRRVRHKGRVLVWRCYWNRTHCALFPHLLLSMQVPANFQWSSCRSCFQHLNINLPAPCFLHYVNLSTVLPLPLAKLFLVWQRSRTVLPYRPIFTTSSMRKSAHEQK